ncbi:MAG: c-type cytochrome, partial [Halobacteriovoraceae bacterium]|nr:c-type cytochrome [Halobacteriovoraceae bacterium]
RANLQKEMLAAQKSLKKLTGTRKLLTAAKAKTDMDPIFVIRNAPLGDFLDPTLKITQVVLPNLVDDRYFQVVTKVDRCMTCHTFIDQPGYEKEKNPFKTHPKLDLMVGKKSTHPMKQFGCTTCHGGEGQRTHDFNSIAHMPQNPEQQKEWQKKYHWHAPHKVPKIMYRKQYSQAGCISCHKGSQSLAGAETLNAGFRNIEKFGCYGCHKINGWEEKRKPGPSLLKVKSKLTKQFFKNWVWEPKAFNKHAKMPRFFNQLNNSKPEFLNKNIAEVNSMAEFIFSISKPYQPAKAYFGGNKVRGKKLITEIGCMGCHGVEGAEKDSKAVGAYAGPFLAGIGSKVKANWLISWLKKPSHYQEDTIMPSFRLTDREAADITAYLMGLKNKKFEDLKFEKMNEGLRDEILMGYFSQFDTQAVAQAKLNKMSSHQRTLELGKRSVGKYGCYSCHNIEGFEGRAPIGPELSSVGSKPIAQFGFGHEKVEHQPDSWIKAHLMSPRRWDNGIDKPFKDLLRMPNFDMSEKEASEITTALMGYNADKIPLRGIKRNNAHEAVVAEGMKVVTKYNCSGCHQIDGWRGDILKTESFSDDINEGPPRLVGQGHRVQANWLHHFLDNVYPIRPWLKVRMPSFNLSNVEKNKLVEMFQAKSKQHTFEAASSSVDWKPGEKAGAKALFKSLDCASCHTTGFNSEDPTAPNLYYAKKRLRASWIKKWLSDPQKIMEGTAMPNFWEDGESTDEVIFGGDKEKQIDALTKYLLEIGYERYAPRASNQ